MDYKNAKVYQILNTVNKDVYVGSTTQPLSKRMAKHRMTTNDKRRQHYTLYKNMKDVGVEHFYIELLENCPCENKEQLRQREGHYIREIGTLNSRIECRTQKEYREEHKDKIKEFQKQYRDENKETNKQFQKQYRENNKEAIHLKQNQYYQNKKHDILEKLKIKHMCECGSMHRISDTARHLRTNKHTDWLSNQSKTQNETTQI